MILVSRWVSALLLVTVFVVAVGLSLVWLTDLGHEQFCARTLSGQAWTMCNDERGYALARSGSFVAVLGIALSAIGTVALVVTIYYTSQATEAAVEASRSARLAVTITQETAIQELRPYMVATGYQSSYQMDASGRATAWMVQIIWKNTGQTPAKNVSACANHLLYPEAHKPLPPGFAYPDRNELDRAVGIVGSDATFLSPTDWIPLDDVADVMAERAVLHVWGCVEYEGFQLGTRYRTEYHCRVRYWGAADPTDPNLRSTNALEREFHGMDSTCLRPPQTPPAARLTV